MNYGYPGSFARNGDCIIVNRLVKSTDTNPINFGDPVVLNPDNTYSKFGASNTAAEFAGVAVREVKQTSDYYAPTSSYKPGQPCDVIERGSVSVVCNVGNPTAGGKVYIRIAANPSIPTGVVGGFEAAPDGANTVELTNCRWATGLKDVNNVAELTILSRNNP
jgi:hypothetical protein